MLQCPQHLVRGQQQAANDKVTNNRADIIVRTPGSIMLISFQLEHRAKCEYDDTLNDYLEATIEILVMLHYNTNATLVNFD